MSASETSAEDLERLASRIALLAGDDGEAEAAGRAVGVLSRRLGLSGGHLKAIFLSGAGRLALAGRQSAEQAARVQRLEGEAGGLQHSLEQLDFALRQSGRERDALRQQVTGLREALDRVRAGRRIQMILAGLVLLAAVGGGAFYWFGTAPVREQAAGPGPLATVRPHGALVQAEPDPASAVLWRLPSGVLLSVRRLVWRNFNQWAEVRVADTPGFVAVTSLQLDASKVPEAAP